MADAEDLKSSGDFSSCGFDSHPGHHFFNVYVVFEARQRIAPFSFAGKWGHFDLSLTYQSAAWVCRALP